MGWASNYIDKLRLGETVSFRPRGNSMTGRIDNGDIVTISPLNEYIPKKGDIVLCKVGGSQYLHLVNAIKGSQYQIANNHGRINGWTNLKNIFGIVTSVGH